MPDGADEAAPSAISAGLAGRCPRCGMGRLFRGFLTVAPRCDQCGLDLGFADAGDGPAVFVTLAVGTLVVGLALILDIAYEPPIWVHLVISLPLAVLLCLAVLRPAKGILVALQYRNRAEQGQLES
ncbi:DUF983 domain-containing protein [Lichenihabitans sp. Uapishka_5]|uniref:DUF983 domain-containing protein n=1 Tax=Lichenihabitans sp. Uapishka_5 TaxID=3037302 RepID=UPI0029F41812|nr:DUF983 domain-containing protein [Lichenihabitans sp. Uapishka_5]